MRSGGRDEAENPEQEMENGPSGLVETELDLKHSTAIYPILDRTSSADEKLRNAEIKNKTTSKIPVFHRRNHLSHLKNQVSGLTKSTDDLSKKQRLILADPKLKKPKIVKSTVVKTAKKRNAHKPISDKSLFSNSEESLGHLDEVCDVIGATDKLVKVKDCEDFRRSDDSGINQPVRKTIDHPQDYCGEIESNGLGRATPPQIHAVAAKIIDPLEPNSMMNLNESPHREIPISDSNSSNSVAKSHCNNLHNNSVDFIEMLTLDAKEFLTIKCVCAVKSDARQAFCKECFRNYKGSLDNINGETSENKSMDADECGGSFNDDSVLISEANGSCEAKFLNNRLPNAREIVVETHNNGEQKPDYKTSDRLSYAKCTTQPEPIDLSQSCVCSMKQSTEINNKAYDDQNDKESRTCDEIKRVKNGNNSAGDEAEEPEGLLTNAIELDLERAVRKFLQVGTKPPNPCALGKELQKCACHSMADSNHNLLSNILKAIQSNYQRAELEQSQSHKFNAGKESDEERCRSTQINATERTENENCSNCSDFPDTNKNGRGYCNENVFLRRTEPGPESPDETESGSSSTSSVSCESKKFKFTNGVKQTLGDPGVTSCKGRGTNAIQPIITDPQNKLINLEAVKPKQTCVESCKCIQASLATVSESQVSVEHAAMENLNGSNSRILDETGNVGYEQGGTIANSSSPASCGHCQPSSSYAVLDSKMSQKSENVVPSAASSSLISSCMEGINCCAKIAVDFSSSFSCENTALARHRRKDIVNGDLPNSDGFEANFTEANGAKVSEEGTREAANSVKCANNPTFAATGNEPLRDKAGKDAAFASSPTSAALADLVGVNRENIIKKEKNKGIDLDPKSMLEHVVNPASSLPNSSERLPSRSDHRQQSAYGESCASLGSIGSDGRSQEQAPISSRKFAVNVVPNDAAGIRVSQASNPAAVNLLLTEPPSDFCQTCTSSEGARSEQVNLIGPRIAAAKQQELTWEFRNGRLVFAENRTNSASLRPGAEQVVCSESSPTLKVDEGGHQLRENLTENLHGSADGDAVDATDQQAISERFPLTSSAKIEVEPPVPQINNCSTDGSILSSNHILSSRDINKRAGDINSRLKYLEDKLKKAGITDVKSSNHSEEDTLIVPNLNCANKDNTEPDKNNNRNNLGCSVEAQSSCDCGHNKDISKTHKYVAFNGNLQEENGDLKVINYSDFQKDSSGFSEKEIVSRGIEDKGINSESEDFIPDGFQDFCQFDVNDLTGLSAFDTNESLGIYDEFLEDSSSDESCDCVEDDHFIVIRRMRGDGIAMVNESLERNKHNPDRENLKSLLKKPGHLNGRKSNRVVFNEKKNEFFDADYIILIREDCELDDDDDDGVCTCQQHEMVRLTCCEPNCNCQYEGGMEPTPQSPKFAPPMEFVDAVTLSPPEGYKDMELMAVARGQQRGAVCRECSATHEGEIDEGINNPTARLDQVKAFKLDHFKKILTSNLEQLG
ncbi:hypothetical protein HUJ04_003035 [Dendroctonus ponderosae]|nr:hypothetical protein HUJ04_003035 [Dendroctonus ponderosae]